MTNPFDVVVKAIHEARDAIIAELRRLIPASRAAPELAPARQPDAGQPDAVLAELRELRRLGEGKAEVSELMTANQAIEFIGISRAAFFRLRSMGKLPRPVKVHGTYPKYRKTDLEKWATKLKPIRRHSPNAEIPPCPLTPSPAAATT